MKKVLHVFILLFSVNVFTPTVFAEIAPTQLWVARYNGLDNGSDNVERITTDTLGNIYVTGISRNEISGFSDYVTIKYDTNGNQLWLSKYDGGDYNHVKDISVDDFGNVYITGASWTTNTSADYVTIKYDTNGNQLWVALYNSGSKNWDSPAALSIDSFGYTYVTGYSHIYTPYIAPHNIYTTVKYDTNGNQVWVKQDDNGNDSYATDLSIDKDSNVYITGSSFGVGYDYLTIKYDTNGDKLWAVRYDGGSHDQMPNIKIDTLGNVYIAGRSYNETTGYSYVLIKYDTNGNKLWNVGNNFGPNEGTPRKRFSVDKTGNIYLIGQSYNGRGGDYAIIKYDTNGNMLWLSKYDSGKSDTPTSIFVDDPRGVYVTGQSYNGTNYDYATVGYDTDGNQLWVAQYDGGRNDSPKDTVADFNGNIYVTGSSYMIGFYEDYVTVKYAQNTKMFWATTRNSHNDFLNFFRKTVGTQNKPSDDIIKTVPSDWVLKVATTTNSGGNPIELDGYQWHGVVDVTDNAVGWMAAKELNTGTAYLSYDVNSQTSLEAKAAVQHGTREARTPIILQAVDTYYTQPNTSKSLYGGGGGRYGDNNFQAFIQGANFPKEAILAIVAEETGSLNHALNNELCSDARDGGIGVMQITSKEYKGLGSALVNTLKIGDCDSKTGWIGAITKYHSNAFQGIFANIKDGFRTLQEKYRKRCPSDNRVIGGLTFTCEDREKILTIKAYHGLHDGYIGRVGNHLSNLSEFFPGVTYSNTDQLVEKLRLANGNNIIARLYSPATLQVKDLQGNITGVVGSTVREDIFTSIYDPNFEEVAIFFPENQYTYRVIGTATGTYKFTVDYTANDIVRIFRALDIPTVAGEIQEYFIDWDALGRGERGVTVFIDAGGDGTIDRTVHSDDTLTEIEPPVIAITSPTGGYILNSQAQVQFTATDAVSGISTVSAKLNDTPVLSGQAVMLTKPGINTLEVTAVDNEGNMAQATSTFRVLYSTSGFLAPIKSDGTGIYNQGRTLPVKFQLTDVNGNYVSTVSTSLYVAKVGNGVVRTDEVPLSASSANIGNSFRYDASQNQYIYNLSTDTLKPGTWQLKAVLDSGQRITNMILIK